MAIGLRPLPLIAQATETTVLAEAWRVPNRNAVIAVALIASGAVGPVLTPEQTPEQVTESRWHQPWSEPRQIVFKKAIDGAFIASISAGPFAPILVPDQLQGFSEARWHQPWSTPLRVSLNLRSSILTAQQPLEQHAPTPVDEVITYDKWGYAWSEPIRLDLRKNLRTAAQQFTAFQLTSTQQPEQVTESRWHQPWSEPVRFKPRLIAGANPALFQSTINPVVSFSWVYSWTDPVRQKVGLKVELQRAFTEDATTNVTFRSPTWYAPLSLPVRLKPGLRGSNQQHLVQAPTPPIVSFSYYDWLSEPVRLPKGLKAFLQRFFDAPARIIPNPIFVTMDATETNNDTIQFSIVTSMRATHAIVSIEEISVPGNDPVSIRES